MSRPPIKGLREASDDDLIERLNSLVRDTWWTVEKVKDIEAVRREFERRGIDASPAFEGDELRVDRLLTLDLSGSRRLIPREDPEALRCAYGEDRMAPKGPGRAAPRRSRSGGVLGWREWRLFQERDTGELALGSLWTPRVWEGPVLRAHLPPADPGGWLGVHGVHSWRPEFARKARSAFPLEGRVLHYGRVMVHEFGLRSQFALVQDLTLRYCTEAGNDAVQIPGLGLEPAYQWWLTDLGFSDVIMGVMERYQAEGIAEELGQRYDCPVKCEEITYAELEALWKSEI